MPCPICTTTAIATTLTQSLAAGLLGTKIMKHRKQPKEKKERKNKPKP